MKEIGSEFSFVSNQNGKGIEFPTNIKDFTLTFCGRSAYETVLKNEKQIKKVLLPSYCCESMIDPFIKYGIDVSFYDVYYDNELKFKLNNTTDIDAIVWCDYFGYSINMPDFNEFKKGGGIIIEDITHSLYSSHKYDEEADYLVASIRKWEPVLCGGYCASVKKKLSFKPTDAPSSKFIDKKKCAMISKKKYLEKKLFIKKDVFLSDFSNSNKWLASNYSELSIDKESLEILSHVPYDKNRAKRKDNASILYKHIIECDSLRFLFDIDKMDCPLFVPIIVDIKYRDQLRKYLIDKNIYCPVHWPKPKANCNSNIYDKELSLICDQRYSKEDMLLISKYINEFLRKEGII